MAKQRIFIGSSQKNVTVARLIRDRLEVDRSINVRIWDEVFSELVKEFLNAWWQKSATTISRFSFGEKTTSPRVRVNRGHHHEITLFSSVVSLWEQLGEIEYL